MPFQFQIKNLHSSNHLFGASDPFCAYLCCSEFSVHAQSTRLSIEKAHQLRCAPNYAIFCVIKKKHQNNHRNSPKPKSRFYFFLSTGKLSHLTKMQFQVLRCFKCQTFNTDIVKKDNTKWTCKLCQEKQSVMIRLFDSTLRQAFLRVPILF